MTKKYHPGYAFRTCPRCANLGHCKKSDANAFETLRRVYVCNSCHHRWYTLEIRCDEWHADPEIVPRAMKAAFKFTTRYKDYDLSLIPVGGYMMFDKSQATLCGLQHAQTRINKSGVMKLTIQQLTTGYRVRRLA